ncbi:MAG: transcriptional repressor LexA [Candidatus Scalindua sp.]|nr:transcriptional repressor LexA [Candidatus Scalindua sp.]
MKAKLTKKQHNLLSFLTKYIRENGYPPTIREMVYHLKLASTNSVKKYLDILERKGYIKRIPNSPRAIEVCTETPESQAKLIPVAGRVRAGAPHLAVEDITGHLAIDASMARWDDTFFLKVEGESMIDAHIQNGDFVLVKSQQTAENGDIVVAIINDEATVKRFFRRDNSIYLEPANSTMKPIIIREDQAHEMVIAGKVVTVLRQI